MKRRIIEALCVVWALAILAGMLIAGETALHIMDALGGLLAGLAAGK